MPILLSPSEVASRAHEIQVGLGTTEVPEFDRLTFVGMAVRLALHIRGLPALSYENVRLIGYHLLDIPLGSIQAVVYLLAEIEFVKLGTEGKTIKTVVPDVPYYETLYQELGEYALGGSLNEAEQLTLDIVHRLATAPDNVDSLRGRLGAEPGLFKRTISIGAEGSYLRLIRARGRDIVLTPTYFSQNSEVFADLIAGGGGAQIAKVLAAIKRAQGFPLALVERTGMLGQVELSQDEKRMVIRLAQDGVVKPPSINTQHAGENFFLFTPTPSGAALASTKRDIYEKAMAVVAATRQGQFLAIKHRLNNPGGLIYTLKRDMKLSRATTEASQQYQNLVRLRIAHLSDAGAGYKQLHIIDTPENREALNIALDLVDGGDPKGMEVDDAARHALQQDQKFVESMVASSTLAKTKKISLTEQQQFELDLAFLK